MKRSFGGIGAAPRVRILDAIEYVTGPEVTDPQLGIVNNLLGTPAFCPLIRLTEKLKALLSKDLRGKITQAITALGDFGACR